MHIPNGFLDPKTSAGLLAAGAALLAVAWQKVRARVTELGLQPVLAGVGRQLKSGLRVLNEYGRDFLSKYPLLAGLIFAAQLFNFPVSHGTSGHLLGGVLAVLFLGPWGGTLALAVVLGIQAVFYADGGLLALGANIINMAGAGCVLSYFIYRGLNKFIKNNFVAIFITAWLSVVLAASFCALELALSGSYALLDTLKAMLRVHVLIGLGEGLLTIGGVIYLHKLLGWDFYHEEK